MTEELITQPAELLELTPLDAWRVQTWIAKLPSGRVVRIRKLNFLDMIERGDIPNNLLPAVRRMLGLEEEKTEEKPSELVDLQEKIGLAAWAARGAMVYPALWDGRGKCPKDAVPIGAMDHTDLLALSQWAMSDWAPLTESPFREICAE